MKARLLLTLALALLPLAPVAFAAETPKPPPGVKRTVLKRTDVPNSNYEVVLVLVEVPANTRVGKHTHPGAVAGYVIEGEYTLVVDGQAPRALKPNDSLEVPAGAVHDEYSSKLPARLLAVFTVEKGKPLTTPVP